jgi:hypothetical protein
MSLQDVGDSKMAMESRGKMVESSHRVKMFGWQNGGKHVHELETVERGIMSCEDREVALGLHMHFQPY